MWMIVTEEQQKQNREAQERIFEAMREDSKRKAEARKAHEACKCPHCGRNDPLPPWLR